MSLRLFEGPAGSGKTTRLFEALADTLRSNPLGEHERVLALTKMHGSRRRMQSRLIGVPGLSHQFDCVTVDSFAWRILRRWRGLSQLRGHTQLEKPAYEEVCTYTGDLLRQAAVQRWVTRRYPILIVDEMQDSKDGQLEIIRRLSEYATCLTAADDFQDLDAQVHNPAVAWARQNGTVVSLRENHRTTAPGLRTAARALRRGCSVPQKSSGFKILGAPNHNVGASFVSKSLTWWGYSGDIAIITPVRAETSPFVTNLLLRVQEKPISDPPVGPFALPWEETQKGEIERLMAELVPFLRQPVGIADSGSLLRLRQSDLRFASALCQWLDRQRRLTGRTRYTEQELREQVELIIQRRRAFTSLYESSTRVMTIHQAKNREFEDVIVLWPYQIAGSAEHKRRLLYNAVTRAKRQAVVIVQGKERLREIPFVRSS